MKARDPMKKRLISLLLAIAMMVAVVPTAAFAGDEASIASSKTLSITADGKPDVTGIVPNTDNGKTVYTGDGWKYEVHPNADYLILDEGYSFDLTNEPAVKCYRVENYGKIQGGVFDPCERVDSLTGVHSGYVQNFGTISGGIFLSDVRAITESGGVTYTPKITGGIFVNDPGVSGKCAIHVTNGGKIKKLKIDSTEVAMDAANLYVVGTSNFDDNLKLTLDDGTVRTVTPDDLSGGGCDLPKHIPLTITEDGIPDISKMTQGLFGYFYSDDWTYDSVSTPENRFPIHLLSNFSGPVGPYPVSCEVVNDGTITDGIFLNKVSNVYDGKITGGIFLQKPTNTDVHTITAGKDGSGTFTNLTVGDQSVALNTNKLYVVGTPTSELSVAVTINHGLTYNFVIPAGSLTTDLTLDTLYSTGSKKLEIKADGTPDTSGAFYYYHSSYPNDRTYFGDGWHYYSTNSPGKSTLSLNDSFNLGSTPITVNVYNNATLTGGIIAKGATLTTQGTIQNVIVYGTLSTYSQAHIENCILLNKPEYSFSPIIQDCIIVNDPGNWMKKAITATDGAKITTIQLGDLTMKLDTPVENIYFLPANSNSNPKKLTVTLSDGTKYEDIDLTQPVITLAPTKRDDPTTYYSVTVEGGEARNERGDILDSEVALTAGEKITLKLLDETQGEMVFSHWDVNNGDTALADELAKTGFDQTAHETTFTMPAHNLTLTAKYRMPDEDALQDDSFLMTAAAVTGGAVLTGLVVWQGDNIFSQVYLNAHLPEGTAIPTNRQQLALLLWNTAGQPEASAASYVFPDVADPDVQTAARWATEQGLFKARKDGTFAPTDSVTTGQVYRAWQKVK